MFWGNATFSKVLSAAAILFILILFQSLISDAVTIMGAKVDLAVIILVYVALTRGPVYGTIFGFLIGLLLDVLNPPTLGWGALIKCLIGFTLGSFKDNLYLESLYSRGAVVFLAVILNDMFYYLFRTGVSTATFRTLTDYSFPSAIYTSMVGVSIFFIMDRIRWERWSVEKEPS